MSICIKDQENNLFFVDSITFNDVCEVVAIVDFEKESYITLGTYKSEERCKEVISKIFENIKQNKYFYEMPEK